MRDDEALASIPVSVYTGINQTCQNNIRLVSSLPSKLTAFRGHLTTHPIRYLRYVPR